MFAYFTFIFHFVQLHHVHHTMPNKWVFICKQEPELSCNKTLRMRLSRRFDYFDDVTSHEISAIAILTEGRDPYILKRSLWDLGQYCLTSLWVYLAQSRFTEVEIL